MKGKHLCVGHRIIPPTVLVEAHAHTAAGLCMLSCAPVQMLLFFPEIIVTQLHPRNTVKQNLTINVLF